MGKNKNKKLLLLFIAGLILVSAVSAPLHFAPGIIVGLVTLLLVIIFYFEQEPNVILVYGAFGLLYIGIAAAIGSTVSPVTFLVLWAIGAGVYIVIYGLLYLFTIWLKKLREISNLHELVIAGTTAGLWKWKDVNKDEQWWSPRYYQLLGYKNDEIPASSANLNDLIHADDRVKVAQVLKDYLAGTRTDMEVEYRMRSKSNEYKWFLGSGEAQFEKDTHRPIRVVGSIVNIDHKKKYELALANQAALLELSPNAIITTDIDFKVRSWNEAAEKMYDIKAADAIGRNVRELYTSTYPYVTEEEMISQFQGQGSWKGEAQQVTRRGKNTYVLASIMTVNDTMGLPDGIVIVNSDLSLLHINKELSAALKMVENSTQYLEQLAYVSSHDLKSPIITLQGLIKHLASSKAIVPGYEAPFEMIKEIVEQMKSTSVALNSILQLRKNLISRDFASDKVSVAQVVKDVLEMLNGPIETSGAQISVDIEKGLQVRIHHTFLKAIVFNLVSNSIKFKHPDRAPVIEINAIEINGNAQIIVSDNGSGINLSRYQNKLFSIFTRFHDGVEGNGIGLHSVKMIVDFHKGEINLDSEENKGTKVTINLPIEKESQSRPANV
jgi:PAS domain S-box-containing protein